MHPGSQPLWVHVISPHLRLLAPGVTLSVSTVFTECVPLSEAGDFVWALMCISQWTPHELLQAYRTDAALPPAHICNALIESACESTDFYGFPAGELSRLFRRLNDNIERTEGDEREAHELALVRIQHVISYVAAAHPASDQWIRNPPKLMAVGPKLKSGPLKPRSKGPRPSHLKLVGG